MELHLVDPAREADAVRRFLVESDPNDYLLEGLPEWIHEGWLWAGTEQGEWVAFGRLHDLGNHEGWVSGLRVAARCRGRGVGTAFLGALLADGRARGLGELRAVIEDPNIASRRLFARLGFAPVFELTLRRGRAGTSGATPLRPAGPGDDLGGSVEWLARDSGLVDLMPGSDGGRFGRWRPELVGRWAREQKLYLGPGMAAAVQVDWWTEPRTLWVSFLRGATEELVPAVASLARSLDHAEWQTFLPFGADRRAEYESLGLTRHPFWGDRVHLFERTDPENAPP